MIREMGGFLKFLLALVVLVVLVFGGAWVWAGRQAGPTIEIRQPGQFIGQAANLDLLVQAPGGRFSSVDVAVEQNGKAFPVYTLDPRERTTVNTGAADKMFVMRPIGKKTIPDLQAGAARIVVRAKRPVLYGLRQVESTATRDVQVRLQPPQVAVLSTFHFVNLGGSEFVVYRVTPDDVASGVRVGDIEYPGYPAKGAGIAGDPAQRVAFF